MGKAVGSILLDVAIVAVAFAVSVIPGGPVISAALLTSLSIGAGVAVLGTLASAVLGPKAPGISKANDNRLFVTLDTTTPRKIAFGHAAVPLDLRYQEYTDVSSDYPQTIMNWVLFHATHPLTAFETLYIEDRLAWSTAGGIDAFYANYLTFTPILAGTAANTINVGTHWGSNQHCTGIAYSAMTLRLIGVDPKNDPMKSPFSSGVPNRMTLIAKGAPVYDPRLDTTVGGSGTMRANDQTTWAFTVGGNDIGRNPVLQILWYLLGWKINGKLAAGRGIPPSRINMATFIAAANVCDETVTSTTFGNEPRYRSDGVFSEGDDPNMVLDTLKACCCADLRDFGGIFAIYIRKNDLANVSVQLGDDDMLGGFQWKQTADVDQTFNEVRGRMPDSSTTGLYQLVDYPPVRVEPVDGIERSDPFDLPTVHSSSQAQRLGKQRLARNQYTGTFQADFNARAWQAGVGKIVELSVGALGWSHKKFRCLEQGVRVDGVCRLILQEEADAIYLWDNSDAPPLAPFVPTSYNSANAPIRYGLGEPGATRNVWRGDWTSGSSYLKGDLVLYNNTVYECIADIAADTTPPDSDPTYWQVWFGTATDGLNAYIAPTQYTVVASYDGTVDPAQYAGAHGAWSVFSGATDVTSQFLPIVITGNPGTLDVNLSGATFAVVGSFDPADDTADLTMQVTGQTGTPFDGISFVRTFRLIKQKQPYPIDHDPPPQPSGLVLSSTIATLPDGTQQATLIANWNASTATDLAYYRFNVRVAGGNFVSFLVSGTHWEGPAIAGVTYEAQLQAVDLSGNISLTYPTPPAVISYAVGGDTTAPAAISTLAASATFQNVFLSWTNPGASDLASAVVYENTTNNSATATAIATVEAEPSGQGLFTRPLATGQTRYYWIKAVDYSGNASAFSNGVTATTAQIDATNELVAGSVTTNLITVNTLNGDRILGASITANKLFVSGNSTNDQMPTGILIGASGVTIGSVQTQANDPLAQANTKSTLLAPGLVLISGATTLASWRNGADNTKIEGGSIAANTVTANKLNVGLRGVDIAGIEFSHNSPSVNTASWSAGTVNYVDDNGNSASVNVAAGSAAWTSATLYLYWVKGATTISSTTNLATANGANNVIFASYRGGTDMVVNYGRTIVDGSDITTGTVTANQLATGYLEASWANITVLRVGSSGARLEIDTGQVRVYDSANVLRVRMGVW